MKRGALATIRFYQRWISPLLPPSCRFYPSCSHYGYEAIARYGLLKGGALAAWRIARCNPFNKGGFDPVPGTLPYVPDDAGDPAPVSPTGRRHVHEGRRRDAGPARPAGGPPAAPRTHRTS